MKKRFLIISYFFAPENTIGAVRPTKLAKYLQRQGHEVTVLCGDGMWGLDDPTLEKDLQELKDVHVLREWNPLRDRYEKKLSAFGAKDDGGTAAGSEHRSLAKAVRGKILKIIHALMNFVYVYITVISDRHFQHLGCRWLQKSQKHYDAVFSTYSPLSVHMIARKAKKMGLAGKWIADCRDEVEVPFFWMRPWMGWYMRMLRKEADVLSAVSGGLLETMGFGDDGRVLTNGFDPDDRPLPKEETGKRNSRFTMAYCGQLRMGRKDMGSRDLTVIFQAFRELITQGIISEEEIHIQYAGDEGSTIRQQAGNARLEDCVTDHGLVTRERSLEILQNADLLLMASWCLQGQTGILSGKLFECLLMNKPMACVVQGDVVDGELARVIRETEAGYCYETASRMALDGLVDYLRGRIICWRAGRVDQTGGKTGRYHYQSLAQQLADWAGE